MAVLINCFILCVWQFISVRPTGVNLPITSLAYKASPISPTSLSLSFSTNDSMDSKITNNFEAFKPVKTSLSRQDEGLSKKTVSVSKLLSKLGSISNYDSTPRDLNFLKQKQNVDPNIFYRVSSLPQKINPNLKPNINDKYDVPKDLQTKKNTIKYNIKVISPPAVLNNLPRSLSMNQNVAGSKILSKTNKYSKNVPPTSLLSYTVRSPAEEGKQESTARWLNERKIFSNVEDGTMYKLVGPQVEKNTINIYDDDVHRNIIKTEDIIVSPIANAKFTFDYDINKTLFDIDSRSHNLFGHQIPIKFLDTSYIQNHDTLPTLPDIININQEMIPPLDILGMHGTETLPKLSPPNLPEMSKPQQMYTSDHGTYNLQLDSSIDNIVSFLKSTFAEASSDSSATNSLKTPALLSAAELLQPHIIDVPDKLSEKPILVATYPEVESPTYLPKPNEDFPTKVTDNAKKTVTKSPIPYISSVTINYMPCIESSNEIMIFV